MPMTKHGKHRMRLIFFLKTIIFQNIFAIFELNLMDFGFFFLVDHSIAAIKTETKSTPSQSRSTGL